jgi:putative oxidoreductase
MNATLPDLFLLGLRLWLGGLMLFVHGWPKLRAPEPLVATLQAWPLPTWSAWTVIGVECLGGACLMLGLRTRVCAGAIALVMLGSAWIAHGSGAWSDGRELRLSLALLALWFSIQGGGPVSLDARFSHRSRRRSPW